jgi:hypothetical protein
LKYIFIAGLEHSGSTLLNHILCECADTVGLGEVASYFSPAHMKAYMERWGDYPDARLCSCGAPWEACAIWSKLADLNGMVNKEPLQAKYRKLIEHFAQRHPEKKLIVDSSKSFPVMTSLVENVREIGLKREDLLVVVAVKDVRSFAASILAKENHERSILTVWRTFDWWAGANKRYLDYLKGRASHAIVLYEDLCRNPGTVISRIYGLIGFHSGDSVDLSHANSHIAMGNKDFIMRNRGAIRYDDRWRKNRSVNMVYHLHLTARRLNAALYASAI